MKAKNKNHGKLYPAIYIEWCDAMSGGDNWIEVSDALVWGNNEDWKIKQFGFLLKETKEYILLAAKLNAHENANETMISHPVKIPKTWIRKRINLTKFISASAF